MNLSRRKFLFCAPAVILTPGLLMPVKSFRSTKSRWFIKTLEDTLVAINAETGEDPFTTENLLVRATVRWERCYVSNGFLRALGSGTIGS